MEWYQKFFAKQKILVYLVIPTITGSKKKENDPKRIFKKCGYKLFKNDPQRKNETKKIIDIKCQNNFLRRVRENGKRREVFSASGKQSNKTY